MRSSRMNPGRIEVGYDVVVLVLGFRWRLLDDLPG